MATSRRTFVVGSGEERWSLEATWVGNLWELTEAHTPTGETWTHAQTQFSPVATFAEVIQVARRWAWDRLGE